MVMTARAGRQLVAGAGELGVGAVGKSRKRRTGIGVPLRPQEPADFHAGLGARHVVKAVAVEVTDFQNLWLFRSVVR
jgi:hypothetical protein